MCRVPSTRFGSTSFGLYRYFSTSSICAQTCQKSIKATLISISAGNKKKVRVTYRVCGRSSEEAEAGRVQVVEWLRVTLR